MYGNFIKILKFILYLLSFSLGKLVRENNMAY
jgi:hypothetical protein